MSLELLQDLENFRSEFLNIQVEANHGDCIEQSSTHIYKPNSKTESLNVKIPPPQELPDFEKASRVKQDF